IDLVFSAVSSNFGRLPLIALLRSPRFGFAGEHTAVSLRDVDALDRALAAAGYLGEPDALARVVECWRAQAPERGLLVRALRAAGVAQSMVSELAPLRGSLPVAAHLRVLSAFLLAHEELPAEDEALLRRHLRAR